MDANIEIKSITADVVVLDYDSGSVDFIELPVGCVESEDIEEYLGDTLGYRMSDIYWMGVPNSGEFPVHYERAKDYQ